MKAIKVIGILAMFLNPLLAEAGLQRDPGPGKVERLGLSTTTLSGSTATLAHVVISRSGNTGWYYAPTSICPSSMFYFDVTTDKGKNLMSLLLLAKAGGKPVSYIGYTPTPLAGSTNCILEELNVD